MPCAPSAQRAAHLARGLVAVAGVERERDRDRVGQLGGDGRDERIERGRLLLLLLERELGQRGRLVGQAAGEQLVGDDAERV